MRNELLWQERDWLVTKLGAETFEDAAAYPSLRCECQ
jgi:hypothetical protein